MKREADLPGLGGIELFCLVAQHGGFTAAARAQGLTTPAISRAVARLEKRLGVRLFTRTTRQVRLTDAGERYYQQCREALDQLKEAEREVTGRQQSAAGLVRISLPTSYGHFRILPILPAFLRRHPGIRVDAQLTNRNVDFADERFDLAVRGRVPPDSGLVARRLEDAALVIVASPGYLREAGRPRSLADLESHECVQFVLPSSGQSVPWLVIDGEQPRTLITTGRLRCHDDILGPITLARAGAGLIQTYRFLIEADLRDKRLVEVLPRHAGASRPFSLVYPGKRHVPARVRLLIDYLVDALAQ